MTKEKQIPELKSAFSLITVLIVLVVLSETLLHFLLVDFLSASKLWSLILDPVLLSVLILPFFYLLVYRPFKNKIIEQEKMHAALRKSTKELADCKYALDQACIVAITDNKGIINYVNDNFCNITKYSRNELVGQDHRLLSSGYHSKDFFGNLWETVDGGKIWRGEIKNKAKDGTFFWLGTIIIPFVNEQGRPFQYLTLRVDITERKKAENELLQYKNNLEQQVHKRTAGLVQSFDNLRQKERRLVRAEQVAQMGSWELNLATGIADWSDEACRIYGLPVSENKQTFDSWISFIHPEDLNFVLQKIKESQDSLSGNSMQHRIICRDGSVKYIYSESKFEFDSNGKPTGIYGIAHDETKQRMAEAELIKSRERYRQMVETTNEGVWLIDVCNKTVFVNKRFSEMFGYSFEEMMGKSNSELMDEEGKAIFKEKIKLRKKGLAEDYEIALFTKSGKKYGRIFRQALCMMRMEIMRGD